MQYDHKSIDHKWQARWEREQTFRAEDFSQKEKFYCLVEFPYPSGAGLHVGHPRSYTALDIVARKKRMEGKNVLYPIGWDAFGLPTENYAIKTGRKPQDVTRENVGTFKRQLQALGLSFDWSREINTTDPAYYKWTQWMFLEFWKAGLAYKKKMPINWCPSCKIGLANEEVVGGMCERCGNPVEKREKEQWMIAITKYADRLLEDLKDLNYLEKIKKQQEDWIGKSEGAEIEFAVDGIDDKINVFTTRPDTLFGATFMVLAPEHPLVPKLSARDRHHEVVHYIEKAAAKTDIERGDVTKEKTGVFTGSYAVNPGSGEKMPIYIADYVMMGYGTGAIMAVPAHDTRDCQFAQKKGLPIRFVIDCGENYDEDYYLPEFAHLDGISDKQAMQMDFEKIRKGEQIYFAYTKESGQMMNSGEFDGLTTEEAKKKMIVWLEEKKIGKAVTHFKLRDWVFSRQRYWGEPIPLVHCAKCGWVAIPETDLPVVLPDVEHYEPTENGESPLATITDWVNTTCPQCGGDAKRETDTMPNWAGSSWYFLRYIDPKNDEAFADKTKLDYWMPVDLYNGGMEHTTLHLLYSRFWNKFLHDRGFVPTSEPYQKRTSHGLVLAEDGSKMSKSKGNVVNPDKLVVEFGADTVRVYEMFMGPFAEPVPWSENGVIGVRRFLEKVVRYVDAWIELKAKETPEMELPIIEKTVKKVTEDIESMHFNTGVAALMKCVNELMEICITPDAPDGSIRLISFSQLEKFLLVMCPFAPHLANELYERIGGEEILEKKSWPSWDAELAKDEELQIAIQVNGKLRGTVSVASDAEESVIVEKAKEVVVKYIETGVKKTIYVKNRLVNFVV
ncbi:MAG: leucine--tRNA ligase [Patescibacteria group bacterium]